MKLFSRSVFVLLLVLALATLLTSGCGPKKTTGAPETPSGAPTTDMAPQPEQSASSSEGNEASKEAVVVEGSFKGAPKGVVAPNVTGSTLDGQPFDLTDYKGKVVMVDFWATWCGPCVRGIPDLIALQSKYGDKGFQVIGFSLDRNESKVEDFVKNEGINYPILVVPPSVAEAWGEIEGIPTTYILDKEGFIRHDYLGPASPQELEAAIEALL